MEDVDMLTRRSVVEFPPKSYRIGQVFVLYHQFCANLISRTIFIEKKSVNRLERKGEQ